MLEMERRIRPHYLAGVAASLAAEVVFIAMVMMVSWLRGKDPWMVTRMPGSFVLGPDAVRPPGFEPGDVLIGMLAHLLLGVLVGLIYAALRPRLGVSPVAGGLITGGILYALGFWILPVLFPGWLSPFWLPPTEKVLQVVAHAVYGWVFGMAFARFARVG
jgi:hypothetical protein